MPKIWISRDEKYPWFDHADAIDESYYDDYLVQVSEDELDHLNKLASYVKEYQETLARMDGNDS